MRGENIKDDPNEEVGLGWEPNDGDSTHFKIFEIVNRRRIINEKAYLNI